MASEAACQRVRTFASDSGEIIALEHTNTQQLSSIGQKK